MIGRPQCAGWDCRLNDRERVNELTELLAAGLVRLRARQSSPKTSTLRESSLDCVANRSGDANP